ncbi:TPA: multidrug efflux SMR transporter [Acinetobacter baumannii]|uniref:DMT family transporter n=1 Tax=Acinetobacter baumannii TaxID=470 RepID=UPI00338F1650
MVLTKASIGVIWLLGAIASDVLSTFFSAKANGLEDKLSQGIAGVLYFASFVCCAIALKYMQAGILYVLWAGIGAISTAFLAQAFLGQRLDMAAWIGIAFIVVGLAIISQFSSLDV